MNNSAECGTKAPYFGFSNAVFFFSFLLDTISKMPVIMIDITETNNNSEEKDNKKIQQKILIRNKNLFAVPPPKSEALIPHSALYSIHS